MIYVTSLILASAFSNAVADGPADNQPDKVRPTGKPINEKVGAWAAGEMAHAIDHWRLTPSP